MPDANIDATIRETLTRLTGQDATGVPDTADLGTAIGLDSLGRLELLSDLEDRFDVTIYDIDSDEAATIGGMAAILARALQNEKETA